ncbi:hypothetical protein TNCV_1471521 [Trichonephila clavipes]|nr:hypothetical protein TNCV_1471521 [Trichonephila clavipes]
MNKIHSQTSRNPSTNRRALLISTTLAASDPANGDGTTPGTEVITLTQLPIRKPSRKCGREQSNSNFYTTQTRKAPPPLTGDQPSQGPHWPRETQANVEERRDGDFYYWTSDDTNIEERNKRIIKEDYCSYHYTLFHLKLAALEKVGNVTIRLKK